ncbi:MAG: DUF5309 family protein [Phycisphaerae bacterium]
MAFTGKATYSAGSTLPEIAEDVSDLIGINSPHETPLLDALGDPARPARSTQHEWLEDSLLPNTDAVAVVVDGQTWEVGNLDRFRKGDLLRVGTGSEVILVSDIDTIDDALVLTRGYGGTTAGTVTAGDVLHIIGNAALEGADAEAARFTNRVRRHNWSQIFSATVEVSGSELAVNQIGIGDELDYQKNQRTRELLRDLENTVINGVANATTPGGSQTVRRSMDGILPRIATNRFGVGADGFPDDTVLSEQQLNLALRTIWQNSAGRVDLILVGGQEKRAINQFVASNRRYYNSTDSFRDALSVYESDFGVCRIVMSRYVPAGTVLLLDSGRIDVMPLAGRSFHYKPLARTGDRESGLVVGEYTMELRNENAHGVISGFTGVAGT